MPKSVVYDANRAALSKSSNLLSGDNNEFVPYDAEIAIRAVASAVGMRLTIMADSDIIVDDKEIPYIGTSLVDKDHVIDTFSVEGGTRLTATLRETANVATTDTYFGVEITPE